MIGRLFTWSTPDNGLRTVTGKPAAIRSAADLDALIARRHAKGNASRKGWETRRKAGDLVERLER